MHAHNYYWCVLVAFQNLSELARVIKSVRPYLVL